MKTNLSTYKTHWKEMIITTLVVVYILINLFTIGGDQFVYHLNLFISPIAALVVTILAINTWRLVEIQWRRRLIWTGLAVGFALWTVAEWTYAIISFLRQETPYPSWADLVFLIGYIPLAIALFLRFRQLPEIDNRTHRLVLRGSVVFMVGVTILWIVIPVLRDGDPGTLLKNFLNILYPLFNLVLLALVLGIIFTFQKGMYGRAWLWLAIGFVVLTISDLAFIYTSVVDLYYPDGRANLLSTLGSDVPYNLGYLLLGIGFYQLLILLRTYHPIKEQMTQMTPVPNTHLFVLTKRDDSVVGVSENYAKIFSSEPATGKTISEALRISLDMENFIFKEIKTKGMLQELSVDARVGPRKSQTILISGIATHHAKGDYAGANLLVRLVTLDSLDRLLPDQQKGIVRSLLENTGVKEKQDGEVKSLFFNYYYAFLQAFYNLITVEGGSILVDAFLVELQEVCQQHGWQVEFPVDSILDVSALTTPEVKEALPVIYQTAKRFITRITSRSTANTIEQIVKSQFDDLALTNFSYFEMEND